jgi:DNA-binding NarL/FixJ family response regulator
VLALDYSNKRVLIVEDQRPFLMLLRGLLNNLGAMDVVTSINAEQALVACRKEKFDMIISDLHLGSDRKNGYEFIEEVRIKKRVKPTTVFLLISADSARPIVLGSLDRRPDEYLIKPFSQAQLKNRLSRAWYKRQFLQPIYQALDNDEPERAIAQARQLAQHQTVYSRYCVKLLIELLWQQQKHQEALELLLEDTQAMPEQWTKLALARTYLSLKKYQLALETSQEILITNRFNADAHDIAAESKSALDMGEDALAEIRKALKLSPLSINRQIIASRLGRENNDMGLVIESNLAIWNLSRNTVMKNVAHWCNYISSILDAAEVSETKQGKNKYQQEALLLLQRSHFDDNLARASEYFDLDIFAQIIHARLDFIDGKLIDSKREIMNSQLNIYEKFDIYPASYVPGSMKVLLDLGEFEEAKYLAQIVETQELTLDSNSLYLLSQAKHKVEKAERTYSKYNRKGIELYQSGKFEKAKEAFIEAFDIAPVNIGIALNLLQCLAKLVSKSGKIDPILVKQCRQVYKVVKGMPLKLEHQKKHESLLLEFAHLKIELS